MLLNAELLRLGECCFSKAPISPLQRYDFILNCEKINTKFFKKFSSGYKFTYILPRKRGA